MANTTNKKFGVVHGAPSQLSSATIEEGKLYFLAGEADGAIKQGIYGVDGITADASGNVTDYNLAMFGCGSVADGTGYGLSQANFTTAEKDKLAGIATNANNYSHPALNTNASTAITETDEGDFAFSTSNKTLKVITGGKRDASGHVSKLLYTDVTLPATAYSDTVYTHPVAGTPTQSLGTIGGGVTVQPGTLTKIATVYDASFDASGHYKGKVAKDISINVAKPSTAGTADEAKKTTGTLTFKVNGTDASAFNGSANTSLNFKNGTNISISEESDGVIKISTSGVPTTTEMNNAINTALTSVLVYKGTVDSSSKLPAVTTATKGHVYVASAAFTTTAAQTGAPYSVESGDYFISNGSTYDVINGENQVSNKNATLSIGGSATIATVDGTDITVSLPSSGYYTHPAAINGSTAVDTSDGGDFAFSTSNKKLQVVTGAHRDASGHISKLIYKDITLPNNAYDNTVYTHPASISGTTLTESSLKSTTATPVSYEGTFTVATGVYRDASGHISKVATETFSLPAQYIHPVAGTGSTDTPTDTSTAATLLTRVKIDASGHVTDTTAFNGSVGGTTTPIYFKAGVPTALSYTIAKSVPSTAVFTDEKVKANTSTGKIYLVGQDDSTNGTTESVYKNASVYMQSGKMYATSGSVASNDTALVNGGTVHTAVQTAKSEAIEAATIYWETL